MVLSEIAETDTETVDKRGRFPYIPYRYVMNLKEAREAVGLSQLQLDKAAGLNNGNVHDIESGRNGNPNWTTVHGIVTALRKKGLKGLKAEDIFPVAEVRSGR